MGETILAGRYRLDQPLGGTMGEVHLASDVELGRRVVVKLLGQDADPARFEREARAAASLAHPNIVQLFEYGDVDGRPYMVFEFLPGGSLEDRLAEGEPLPDAETERIARDVAAGLAHAHARGLVHRDLKPANVLFDEEGRAKIADFGIARLGGAGTLTEAGTVLGTASYISPEQASGEKATLASDVYSFGVLLFRMLTGNLPFTAESPLHIVEQHRKAAPPPVTTFREDAPARLESVTAAALAKDPRDRPPTGGALLAELGDGTGEETTVMPVAGAVGAPWRSRMPIAIAGTLLALLALAGIGLAVALTHTGSSPSVPPAAAVTRHRHRHLTQTQAPTPATQSTTQPTTTRAHRPKPVITTIVTATLPLTTATLPTTAPPPTTTPPPTTGPAPTATGP